MNSKQVVFLDTSIQIERFMGLNRKRAAIEQKLADPTIEFVTSNYVFMEFQRSVLSNYAYVYNQILTHDDWEMVAYAVRSGPKGFRPRALGQCFQILTAAIDRSERNRRRALEFLKIHITRDLPKRFWYNVIKLPDPIVCDLVQSGVTQEEDRYTVADSCRKVTAACHLPNFLTGNKAKLQLVADYLLTNPHAIKNQRRVEQLLGTAIKEPRAVLGQAACWPLGDLIIALQIPTNASLWTLDADFGPLAEVLGFPLYALSD